MGTSSYKMGWQAFNIAEQYLRLHYRWLAAAKMLSWQNVRQYFVFFRMSPWDRSRGVSFWPRRAQRKAKGCSLLVQWLPIPTHAAATSFAASLLFEDFSPHHNLEGYLPPLGHLLSHKFRPVPISCLPARWRKVWTYTYLHLPYHKHKWRLASIRTICARRLPSTTALYRWTFCGLKRTAEKKTIVRKQSLSRCRASIVNKVRVHLQEIWPCQSRLLYKYRCTFLAAKLGEMCWTWRVF